jgi:hypothetical protein
MNELSTDEEYAFANIVDASIIARYKGNLSSLSTDPSGGVSYTPLDTIQVQKLLVELWGERLTKEAIAAAFGRLTQDGACEWPLAWCEEEADDVRAAFRADWAAENLADLGR